MDLSAAAWVRDVTDARLKQVVGAPAFFRGQAYASDGAIDTLEVNGPGTITAVIRGQGHHTYRTEVRRDPRRLWSSTCSCPVRFDCKHAIAVILTVQTRLRATPQPRRPAWERALAPLVGSSDSGAVGHTYVLGLEFSLLLGWRDARPTGVQVRPLREGTRTPWVKQGVSWRELTSTWPPAGVDPRQRELLAQFYHLGQSNYYQAPAAVPLASLNPLAWPLLRRIVAAGVVLVPGDGLTTVELGDGDAELTLDVTRASDGSLSARPRISLDATPDDTGTLVLLGKPAHGLAQLRSPGELTLWPLSQTPSDGLHALIEQGRTVTIPAADTGRFLALYYPALARQGAVSSSDGSVQPPDLSPPRLHLDLTHEPGHVTRLRWGFAYPPPLPGSESIIVPLVPDAGGPPRDHLTERELASTAAMELAAHEALVHPGQQPSLVPVGVLSGIAVAPFITTTLPRLRELGVEVIEHGEAPDYAEATEPPIVYISSDDGDDPDWFSLHVTVTVAGQQVPFQELFTALARGDGAMLLASGTWFSLDQPELATLKRLIEEARDLTDADPSAPLRLTPLQAGLWEELVQLGVVERQSARWRDAVEGLLSLAERSDAPPPERLSATLRPYQVAGYRWLTALWDAKLGGVLADDMGLGKTLQSLALFERARERGELDDAPVLVVAPASVVGTWVDEATRFAPELRVAAITATHRRRGTDLSDAVSGAHVVVTSYTLLRLEDEDYRALPWSGLVLDEAQFVKNYRSRTYAAARRLGAPFTLAITGTPLENSLMDLWSMMSLAAPGLFAKPERFTERFRKPIENGHDPDVLASLRRRVRPFMLRRTKKEVVTELPDKIEQIQHIELSSAHRKVYDKHLQRERQRVLGMLDDMQRNRVAIFRALTALRQLALDPQLVDESYAGATSAKVTALVEQVRELAAEGHRALVFSSFTGFLALVRAALDEAGIGYVYLDGRTRDRPARIAQFRTGDDPVFLISLKAGGFGLTLTEADYVFVLDPWWNPAAENQAIDRTHRIGQTRAVNVYRMVSVDTIEEKVVALQERKRDLFTSVIDSGDFASGAITASDIRGLFDT